MIDYTKLVAATGLALSKLTPLLLAGWTKRDDLDLISSDLKKTLQHTWTGSFRQKSGLNSRKPLHGRIAMHLKCSKRLVRGSATFSTAIQDKETASDIHVLGGIRHGQFLHIEYLNVDPSKVHFGTILLVLSANRKTMEGRFLGYGYYSGKIVEGSVTLERAAA